MNLDPMKEITNGLGRLELMNTKTGLPAGGVRRLFKDVFEYLEQGGDFDEYVNDIANIPVNAPAGRSRLFVHKLYTSVARYALAAWLIQIGNAVGAWQAIYCASLDHGSAMAIQVASLERIHERMTKSKKGGEKRGAKNAALKEWVFAEYSKSAGTGAYEAGAKLALRFEKPFGNPELKLAEFGSNLSKDNLAKTFGNWINKEFFPVSS